MDSSYNTVVLAHKSRSLENKTSNGFAAKNLEISLSLMFVEFKIVLHM